MCCSQRDYIYLHRVVQTGRTAQPVQARVTLHLRLFDARILALSTP